MGADPDALTVPELANPDAAAESYTRAGAVEGYPLRHWALADATRCLLQAGETSTPAKWH